jgi:hypothetical protein
MFFALLSLVHKFRCLCASASLGWFGSSFPLLSISGNKRAVRIHLIPITELLGDGSMRLLYVLSAAGFALFLSGLYSARKTQPQKRAERRPRRSYSGPMIDLNEASIDELRAIDGLGEFADRILDERPFRTNNESATTARLGNHT